MYLWKMKELVLSDDSQRKATYAGKLAHIAASIGMEYKALKSYTEGASLNANVGHALVASIKAYSKHYATVYLVENSTPLLGEHIHMWIREHRVTRREIVQGTGMTTQWVTIATRRDPPTHKFLQTMLPIVRKYDSGNEELISLIKGETGDTRANSIHFSFRDDWCIFVTDLLYSNGLTVVECASEINVGTKTLGDCISGRISPSVYIQKALESYVPRTKKKHYTMLCKARNAAYTRHRVKIVSMISRKLFTLSTMELEEFLQEL